MIPAQRTQGRRHGEWRDSPRAAGTPAARDGGPARPRGAAGPPPDARAGHAALQRRALRTFEQIREMLSVDQEQLFATFQRFDADLSGRMDPAEFRRMLQAFDPSINVRAMDSFLEDVDSDGDRQVTFTELLDWWEVQKADQQGAANDAWFMTQLKAQFAAQVAKDLWGTMTGQSEIEQRISRLTIAELNVTVDNYRDDLFSLRLWFHDSRSRSEEQVEARLLKQAEHLRWSTEEVEDLKELFFRVTRGRSTLRVEAELPRLCALLNFDIPYSCVERTLKVFDRDMTFKAFLVFWAARPESGKLQTGKNPVWRWGTRKPTGSEAAQP